MTNPAPASDHPYPIRPVTPEELDDYRSASTHAFHGSPLAEAHRELVLSLLEFDRTLAAFDGPGVVGTAAVYSFQLSVPGHRTLPAAGVTWVSVLPSHRRRGILTSLMRRQLADVRDRGEPLAVLWASESVIYPRYGYGRSMWHADFTLHRGEGALAAAAFSGSGDGRARVRITEPEAALPELAKVYDAVFPARPGFIARNEAWWRKVIYDPAEWRHGASPLHCVLAEDESGPRGYALYSGQSRWDESSLPDGVLNVREMVAIDPAAGAALWADLLGRDLTSEFRVPKRPVDDPLLFQLADPRRARPVLKDALWTRITDLPAALAGRGYSAPMDVVIEVRDGLIPANAGRWHLAAAGRPAAGGAAAAGAAAGGAAAASCEPTSAAADLALDVTELGAAYLGGITLGAMAAAGLVTELRPGAVRELSAAMAWDLAPWCPVDF
jgi:predicted acetyltransferase